MVLTVRVVGVRWEEHWSRDIRVVVPGKNAREKEKGGEVTRKKYRYQGQFREVPLVLTKYMCSVRIPRTRFDLCDLVIDVPGRCVGPPSIQF